MTEPVVAILARNLVASRDDVALPWDDARTAIADWLGGTVGGMAEAVARPMLAALGSTTGPSRVVGGGLADVTVAALVNGNAAHVLEVDDIFAPGMFHPGAPIVAAALATADQCGSSVGRLWRAVILGYEVGCRVAQDLGREHYASWHTTGTAGSIGAAAAVADLLDLDEAGVGHALSLGATMSAGLQQTFRQDAGGKPVHSGHAAMSGVIAAYGASVGVTGAAHVLEGPAGLGVATGAGVAAGWQRSRADFGVEWAVQRLTIKPYPCCGHTFAPIAAAMALRAAVDPSQILMVRVETYGAAIDVAGTPMPSSPSEARFSIPFAVALALHEGAVRRESFELPTRADPALRRTMGLVELVVDDTFHQAFPARRGATVTLRMEDGTSHVATVPDRPGSPENPLTGEEIRAKFVATASSSMGVRATDMWRDISTLAPSDPVSRLPFE